MGIFAIYFNTLVLLKQMPAYGHFIPLDIFQSNIFCMDISFPMDIQVSNVKKQWKTGQIFLAFLEYLNFKHAAGSMNALFS